MIQQKGKQKPKNSTVFQYKRMLSSHSLEGLLNQKRSRKQTNNFNQSVSPKKLNNCKNITNEQQKKGKMVQKQSLKVGNKKNDGQSQSLLNSLSKQRKVKQMKMGMRKQIKKKEKIFKNEQKNHAGIKDIELKKREKKRNQNNLNESKINLRRNKNKEVNQNQIDNQKFNAVSQKKLQKYLTRSNQSHQRATQNQSKNSCISHSSKKQTKNLSKGKSFSQKKLRSSSQRAQKSQIVSPKSPQNIKITENIQSSVKLIKIGRRLLRARKNIDIEQDKQQNEGQGSNMSGRKREFRNRKGKGQVYKKFMLLEGLSDNEDLELNEGRKKRGVADKDYQINRIFRKTDKFHYPSALIDCNITKISFPSIVEKFGTFDIVHCSLPLDMLVKLPQISCLIPKGFLFIWAQFGQIQLGYHWLNRLGFDVIDQIMWIKTNEDITECRFDFNCDDQIFLNCRSTCLVGYKCSASQKTEYCTKISNNLIFSPEKVGSILKPEEIYDIQDLMMPGAKKLEIGLKEVEGWLTLRHHQNGLLRCWQCLKKQRRNLFVFEQGLQVKCEACIKQNIVQIEKKKNGFDQQEAKVGCKQYKLQIVNLPFCQSMDLVCEICQKQYPQLLLPKCGNENIQQPLSCSDCLSIPIDTNLIIVHNLKSVYFPTKQKKCFNCQKTSFKKQYFACFSCKSQHTLCSQCFSNIPSQSGSEHWNHDWRLVPIYQTPQMKTQCFSCGDQCMIPYWGCQTCQNWYWCGKCDRSKGNNGKHCHYESNHHLHLII